MKTRFLSLVLGAILVLCGCGQMYRYTFETVISGDGRVERTVTFVHEAAPEEVATNEEAEVEEPPVEIEEAEEAAPLPPWLIVEDTSRFERFEKLGNGFTGTWRSDGKIHTDFRVETPSYTPRDGALRALPDPKQWPAFIRDAHNKGLVTVSDFGLVKTINYVEVFQDYYTGAEFERHADMVIETLAEFFLDILHEDLAEEYDLEAFHKVIRETVVPLVKRNKHYLWREVYSLSVFPPDEEKLTSVVVPAGRARFAHEAIRLGLLDDVYFNAEKLVEKSQEWGLARMHETIKRKKDRAPWTTDEIEEYFAAHGPFSESGQRLAAKRYGDNGLNEYVNGLYDSFAITLDDHLFKVSVTVPGRAVYVTPRPDSLDEAAGSTTAKWSFDEDAFFPDGVVLSLGTAVPVMKAQVVLFGRVALDQQREMGDYLALLQRLESEDREVFLETLKECVEKVSLDGLVKLAKGRGAQAGEEGEPVEAAREEDPLQKLVQFVLELEETGEEE